MLSEEPELGYRVVGVVGSTRGDAPWGRLPKCVDTRGPSTSGQANRGRRCHHHGWGVRRQVHSCDRGRGAGCRPPRPGLARHSWGCRARGCGSPRCQAYPSSTWNGQEHRHGRRWPSAPLDIVITIAISPLVLPVLVAAAICIKLEDGGPVLYHHTVIGRYGELDHRLEAQDHGAQRHPDAGRLGSDERANGRAALQSVQRSPGDEDRSPPASHQHRRAARSCGTF